MQTNEVKIIDENEARVKLNTRSKCRVCTVQNDVHIAENLAKELAA